MQRTTNGKCNMEMEWIDEYVMGYELWAMSYELWLQCEN